MSISPTRSRRLHSLCASSWDRETIHPASSRFQSSLNLAAFQGSKSARRNPVIVEEDAGDGTESLRASITVFDGRVGGVGSLDNQPRPTLLSTMNLPTCLDNTTIFANYCLCSPVLLCRA